jgi:predicted transcriptional regulator
MARVRQFKLKSSVPGADEKEKMIKSYHQAWRNSNSASKAPFIPIFTSFKEEHLATIEPAALRLYLFFAFAANNLHGNSWHSIESIAKFFNTQTRTVNNWIKILVDKNLIYREQKGKRSHTTYLIPYSTTIIGHTIRLASKEDNQKVLDAFVKRIKEYEFLYGAIHKVFHFFQWKTDSKKDVIPEGKQWLIIITKRPDGILTGHNVSLRNSDEFGVNDTVIDDGDIGTFVSPFQFNNQSVKGLVLTHSIKVTSNSNAGSMIKLIEDLAEIDDLDLEEHQSFEYGKISDLFPDEFDTEDDTEEDTEN